MENDKTYVIAIGRQFGCGGREIGQLIAKGLGVAYYDKELLSEAAKSSGVNEDFFEAADERSPRFFSSLWSFNLGYNTGAYFIGDTPLSDDSIYRAQSEVMTQLADRGPCVIVGRTADYLLRDHCKVVSVFVHSSIEDRVQRIMSRGDAKTEKEAREKAEKKNKLRAEYYNFYTDKKWGDAASYDLSIDASLLGTQATAMFIIDFVKKIINKK
ncbi:cytidylate kinase-like family protein [Sodaliphilus pleomorphus]|jgi:cytidylate kinase|uniref:Cytidylate kinase-like family protein n=1 Tax=Sodaliphilus pleomorphus TaxID=2606626 RepID=A0A6L5XCA3_9BACT|nr:cytidylate kinase-like family protein [Sodaliphilus pleomorphus]MDD6475158.1 cytidylate kinase-like family protein [Sodaliphilus pleomorphus]MDD6687978.1 cytidylate kinase-like family protein [Sodaliphilus pleomorphus]MDY6258664.1 cytidylate kinase-like family protein [Bacteroidales bacterium]MSS18069.1 cytidylate kinase-like family protein [Sodaliphilus pleomorphus]